MELLIVWIITIIISLSMEQSFGNHLMKDVHNSGYKMVLKIEGKNSEKTNNNLKKYIDLTHFIPFINLFFELKIAYNYTLHKEEFINEYLTKGLIQKMTEEEFNDYKSTKNYNKAMIKLYENSIKFINIQLDDGSNIEYCYTAGDEDINKIIITKVTGPAKNLNDDEIKSKIEKNIKKDVNQILKKLEDHENINNKENYSINITEIDNQNIADESNEKDKTKTLAKKNDRK